MGESRQIKEARRRLAGIAKQVDADKRKSFRYPLWRLLVGLIFPKVKKDYYDRWEKKHHDAIAKSMKSSAHIITDKAKATAGGSVKKMMLEARRKAVKI